MSSHPLQTDVAIIGAGPVGLFAIFECGMLRMRCHVIDSLEVAGGQCAALYPEKPIFDIPAYPRIDAGELIERLGEELGVTSILVTHDIEGALPISDHVAMLDRGRIRFVGTPQEFRNSDDTLVRAFLERDAMTGPARVLETA